MQAGNLPAETTDREISFGTLHIGSRSEVPRRGAGGFFDYKYFNVKGLQSNMIECLCDFSAFGAGIKLEA